MEYCFNGGCWGAVFAVPNSVVDNYIKLANEASVKVLLFVLRNSGKNFSANEIASALNLTSDQVEESFVFWDNANIISKSGNNDGASRSADTHEKQDTDINEKYVKKSGMPSGTAYSITPTEIADRISRSEDVRVMFAMAEKCFGHPLNHTEQRSFIWMHDYLGMPADVIVTIAAYCLSIDKGNIKYIEKISANWAENGINTLERVQEEIKLREEKNSFNGKVMKEFGMSRRPTSKQQEFIDGWRTKGYSMELIGYACEKTIEAIDKVNFPYINKILESWYEKGLLTKSKIDSEEKSWKEEKRSKKNNENEHSYDLNEYKSLVNNFGDKQ
ncbi:MAG: DnaD domain protein [Clostridium sp.]|nr:DnaD domain protein [Clostridium sp.]MCM1547368.1 DnaD domain protein [Ruminococcus sp.]